MSRLSSLLPLPLGLPELILLIIRGRRIKETKTWGREARVLFPRMSRPKRAQNKPGQPKTWWIKELKPRLGFPPRHLPLYWMKPPFSLMHPLGVPIRKRRGYVADALDQALLLPFDMSDLRTMRKHEVFLSLKKDLAQVILLITLVTSTFIALIFLVPNLISNFLNSHVFLSPFVCCIPFSFSFSFLIFFIGCPSYPQS